MFKILSNASWKEILEYINRILDEVQEYSKLKQDTVALQEKYARLDTDVEKFRTQEERIVALETWKVKWEALLTDTKKQHLSQSAKLLRRLGRT